MKGLKIKCCQAFINTPYLEALLVFWQNTFTLYEIEREERAKELVREEGGLLKSQARNERSSTKLESIGKSLKR